MAGNKDSMVITGVKVEYFSRKENECGQNHVFNALVITPLQQLVELRKSLKMKIWDYNDKFYLEANDLNIRELPGEHLFQTDVPYIMDVFLFRNTTFKRMGSKLLVSISQIN